MYRAIAANKRNTVFIMMVFVALVAMIAWAVSYYYGNTTISFWVIGVALIYALIQYFAASRLALSVTGAQEIQKSDNPRLYRIVENLSITLGLPMPKVYIIPDPAPNAMATGRNPKTASVAATSGILDIMNDRELEAVLAHEMGHVQNYDIRVSMIAFGLVSVISLITDIAFRMFFFGNRRNNNDNQNPIVLIVGIALIILAPIIAAMIQLAISRQREYLADASGVMTTRDTEGLVSALEKLEQFGRPMQKQNSSTAHLFFNSPLQPGFFANLFSTHPPLEARIARLKSNEGRF